MAQYQGPRGTNDLFGQEIEKWHVLEERVRDLARRFQLEEIRTPEFEHTEVFARQNDSSDVVNKEMYTFEDRGGRSLTLKPEGTAGVMRAFVEHKLFSNPEPLQRFYYLSPVFRYERPQKGRLRIHHQFGVEMIGVKSPLVDVEGIVLALTFLKSFGLTNVKLLVNSLGDTASRLAYQKVLQDYFKEELPHLCPDCQRRYHQNTMRILDCKVDGDKPCVKSAPQLKDYLSDEAKTYFDSVLSALSRLGISYELDPSLVRGFDYYTDTVFEIVPVGENLSNQSTIIGGGRFDNLVTEFGGPELSCFGFGCGLERFLLNCEEAGLSLCPTTRLDVYGLGLSDPAQEVMFRLIQACREAGLSCDYDMANRSLKAQFKSAARKNSRFVLILGEEELAKGHVLVKNQDNPNQVEVAYDQLVNYLKGEIKC